MPHSNRLTKLVQATNKLPQSIRTRILSAAFGRVVPMVGAAKIRYITINHQEVIVKIENHKSIQNHIGQVHACAMALIAETATGFVTAMNVPDHCIVLIKSLNVQFKTPSQGSMQAHAQLTAEQQQLMQTTDKGETLVSVIVTDESGQSPIECEMIWAWVAKSYLKKQKK